MPATLRTLKATVQPDAVVTLLLPSRQPNAETVAAMHEPVNKLPRFASAAQLLNILDS